MHESRPPCTLRSARVQRHPLLLRPRVRRDVRGARDTRGRGVRDLPVLRLLPRRAHLRAGRGGAGARGPRALGDRGTRGPQAPPAAPQRPKAASQSGLRLSDPLDPSVCLQPGRTTTTQSTTVHGHRQAAEPPVARHAAQCRQQADRPDRLEPQRRLQPWPGSTSTPTARYSTPPTCSNEWQPAHRPLKLADLHAHYAMHLFPMQGNGRARLHRARCDRLRDKLRRC